MLPTFQMSKLRFREGRLSVQGLVVRILRARCQAPHPMPKGTAGTLAAGLWNLARRLEGVLEGVGIPGRVGQTPAASFQPGMLLGSPGPALQGSPSSGRHTHHLTVTAQTGQAWESRAQGRGPPGEVPDPSWVSRKASQRR